MIEYSAHRRVERLIVPRHFRGPGLETGTVQLLDLSPAGARIEHFEPFRTWSSHPIDLPRALGGGRVKAEVVWSRVSGRMQDVEGKDRIAFQSGLAFIQSTAEEQRALSTVLLHIAGEWALGMLREVRRWGKLDPLYQERFDTLCGETLAWLRREIEALRFDRSR